MDIALERQFNSLLTALKAVSLAALIPAVFYFIETLSFVSKAQRFFNDMVPEGTPIPARWAFVISDLLSANMLFFAPIALAGIGACIWVTVQYKSAHFLYLNLGLCLLLFTLGAIMRSACFRGFGTIISEMNPYP